MNTGDLPAIEKLNSDAKRRLFILLAQDLQLTAGDPVLITDAGGSEMLVYLVPADARDQAARALRAADPARVAELRRRAADPDRSFSPD